MFWGDSTAKINQFIQTKTKLFKCRIQFKRNQMFFFTTLIGLTLSVAINDTTVANRTEVDGLIFKKFQIPKAINF